MSKINEIWSHVLKLGYVSEVENNTEDMEKIINFTSKVLALVEKKYKKIEESPSVKNVAQIINNLPDLRKALPAHQPMKLSITAYSQLSALKAKLKNIKP
jgi:hypothetical protein